MKNYLLYAIVALVCALSFTYLVFATWSDQFRFLWNPRNWPVGVITHWIVLSFLLAGIWSAFHIWSKRQKKKRPPDPGNNKKSL